MKTLAFDVYGTLIDTHGVIDLLGSMVGDEAAKFSQTWRDKQLEYSFRRGLKDAYQPFSVCTEQALDYTAELFAVDLPATDRRALMAHYLELPAFDDVTTSLEVLRDAGHSMYAFSNGTADAVTSLLHHAGIADFFIDIVSVDELQTFKPNPSVYQLFLDRSGATAEQTWLVSSNPFDVIGALGAGLSAAWVKRSATAVYDPWGIEPTATVSTLSELGDCFE